MSSRQDHRIGKTIYADDIVLVKRQERESPRGSLFNAELQLIQRDYASVVAKIGRIDSDNIVTPQEKKTLQREWEQLLALRSMTLNKAEEYGIQHQTLYQEYSEAFTSLDSLVSYILDPINMSKDTDISEQDDLSDTFGYYFSKAKLLDEQLFRYETGMIGGLDYRVRYDLKITPSIDPLPLDGTNSILSATLFNEDNEVTDQFDDDCFTWVRISEGDDAAWKDAHSTPSKTLMVNVDDLVYGHATFMCKFKYYYSETMYVAKNGILSLSKEVPGPAGEPAYQLQVLSYSGTIYKPNKPFTSILTVRVWLGGEEVTSDFEDGDFRWTRSSENPASDDVWNSAHYTTGGKTLQITEADIVGGDTVFYCTLLNKKE